MKSPAERTLDFVESWRSAANAVHMCLKTKGTTHYYHPSLGGLGSIEVDVCPFMGRNLMVLVSYNGSRASCLSVEDAVLAILRYQFSQEADEWNRRQWEYIVLAARRLDDWRKASVGRTWEIWFSENGSKFQMNIRASLGAGLGSKTRRTIPNHLGMYYPAGTRHLENMLTQLG